MQLLDELVLVGGARAGTVVELRLAAQAELGGALGERLGEQRDRTGAVLAQRQRMAGQLTVPGGERRARRAAGADAREQGVALREHP